ncbi:MAG: DoxX family protein [Acetobacteraceae bacterium]
MWNAWQPRALSVLRLMTGLLFLEHGTAKLLGFPPGTARPAMFGLLWVSGVIELVAGGLVTVGLYTRIAAFIASGEMAVAYFQAHAPQNFYPLLNRGDAAILYCFVFLYLVVAGGGSWSLDRIVRRRP